MIDVRHHRQRILAEVGESGQARLARASVLVVGLGGLGSPVATYLAAAGVGRLGLLDDQPVELSNLQRQILFSDGDVGTPKAQAAAQRLRAIDPALELEPIRDTFRPENAERYARAYDVLVDGSDSFDTKFLLNDAAVLLGRPMVHGAVLQWSGQVTTVRPGGPCLRCLFYDPPEPGAVATCEEAGILGATSGVVGSVQAEEVLKLLLGVGQVLSGRLFVHDGLRGDSRVVEFRKDAACPVCSDRRVITGLSRYAAEVSARGHVRR